MSFQPAPRVAEAVINGLVNGVGLANVLTFAFDQLLYTQTDIDNLAAGVDLWMATEVLPNLSGSANYLGTSVRGLANQEDFQATNTTSAGPGLIAGTPLSNNVSFCIKFETGLTGRTSRGRSFLWGMPNIVLGTNENELTAANADQYLQNYENLNNYTQGTGWLHCVCSRRLNGVQRAEAVFRYVSDYSYTSLTVATQRRRLR